MNEHIISDLSKALEAGGVTIPQVTRLPRSVETTAKNIDTNFRNTAELLVQTAVALEIRAALLREKGNWLLEQQSLADELRTAVTYEREAFEEVQSLALIDVGIRPSDG